MSKGTPVHSPAEGLLRSLRVPGCAASAGHSARLLQVLFCDKLFVISGKMRGIRKTEVFVSEEKFGGTRLRRLFPRAPAAVAWIRGATLDFPTISRCRAP